MRHNKLKTIFAWLAMLSIGLASEAFAQVPSLVTQQTRLSTGGLTPNYVQLRAKAGVLPSPDFYSWDQAPVPTAGMNYTLWLDQGNNIERSAPFGPVLAGPGTGTSFYLQRVNAAGTGLEWVLPNTFVQANNGLVVDAVTIPGTDVIQLGAPATGGANLLTNRFVTMGGQALNFDGSGSFNVGTGGAATLNMTLDPGAAGFITMNDIGTSITTTKFVTLDATNHVITRDLTTLVVADNGLTINAAGGYVELGGAATGTAPLLVDRFVSLGGKTLNIEGSGNFNLGDGAGVQAIKIDPSATGSVTINNLPTTTPAAATDKFVYLDVATNKASTRTLSSLVAANNGLNMDLTIPATPTVEMGGPLIKATAIDQAGFDLTYTNGSAATPTKLTLGNGTNVYNISMDPSATGNIVINNIQNQPAATSFLVLDATNNVKTRALSTLVVADNGISINAIGGFVELGGPVTGTNPLIVDRFVTLGGHALNFDGAGSFNVGDGANAQAITLNPSATGSVNVKNLAAAAPALTDRFMILDPTDKAFTRTVASLVNADNGLSVITTGATDIVELGGPTGTPATFLSDRFIDQSTKGLSLTDGTLNLGAAAGNYNINIDLGATTNNINMKNILGDNTTTKFLTLDAVTGNVRTRDVTSLVSADNGLSINPVGGIVELGGPLATPSALLNDRYVALSTFAMNFNGAGSFNVGDGTVAATNITLDEGTGAGSINLKNVANDAAPLATDRFVVMTAASDKVLTRALTSLVNANEGLVVDNALTPGTSTVQLGAIVDGTNPIDVGRFVTFTGATPSLTYDGTGTMNLGTTGNLALNINTGTQPMTVQGTTLAAAAAATPAASKFHNIVYVDETSHAVQTVTAANMARNDAPTDFVAIDPATGNFVKAVSPTAGVTRGQIAGTGAFQYTSPAINIAANASITCTIENHTGVLGAIVVQVTNVTTGAAGTFSVESSESIQAGSFINYIVMN